MIAVRPPVAAALVTADDAGFHRLEGAPTDATPTARGEVDLSLTPSMVLKPGDDDHRLLAPLVEDVAGIFRGEPGQQRVGLGLVAHQFGKAAALVGAQQHEGRGIEVAEATLAPQQNGSGGQEVEGEGFFVQPTVLVNTQPRMKAVREEIFGPVLAVMPFSGYDEGLALANDTDLGLTAAVYTKDLTVAHRFANDVEAGFVWVNDSSRHFIGAPFGGYKNSGIGREEDIEELESYTQVKNVNVWYSQ